MIQGLSHLTFIVSDLDKMENLLTYVFDAEKVYDSGDKMFSVSKERFFLIGDIWIGTMEGEPLADRTYNHTAFKIEDKDFEMYLKRINDLGLDVKDGRPRVEGEGQSIYFYDYDNHMLELHTSTLEQRLERYREAK